MSRTIRSASFSVLLTLLAAPAFAGEVGVTNSYSHKNITCGFEKLTAKGHTTETGTRDSYLKADKKEWDLSSTTEPKSGYVATSHSFQKENLTVKSHQEFQQNSHNSFSGGSNSHSVSAFAN